ncbi:MAG: ORF6N domain-containing protein [Ignavibacteriales bacterium]|nr:ORF6N domain-containing protein [Ignavibacteriales bacterium]
MNYSLVPSEVIEQHIYLIRNQKVMLDRDLADLYGVSTKILNQAVKRNLERFPEDFMFQLSSDESETWWKHVISERSRSQFVTLKRGENIKYQPFAFTEHGILMLSSVLRNERAIAVNIAIMRAFVKLREILASQKDLVRRLDELEQKYDEHFQVVFDAIRQLMTPPEKPKHKIGFCVEEPKAIYRTRRKRNRKH